MSGEIGAALSLHRRSLYSSTNQTPQKDTLVTNLFVATTAMPRVTPQHARDAITPEQRLDILRAADTFRKWYSLDDKRACVVCERVFTNDETDGEATRKCAEQGCSLVGKRHRQHKADVQRSENYSSDQTQKEFRHVEFFSEDRVHSQHLTSIRRNYSAINYEKFPS